MDAATGSALQQLADDRLDGKLRERVEQLRSAGLGWRPIAEKISEEARLGIGYESLRKWADKGEWDVNPDGAEQATA